MSGFGKNGSDPRAAEPVRLDETILLAERPSSLDAMKPIENVTKVIDSIPVSIIAKRKVADSEKPDTQVTGQTSTTRAAEPVIMADERESVEDAALGEERMNQCIKARGHNA